MESNSTDNDMAHILASLSEETLFSEIAGMDEVGHKSPRGRMPGKTNLPKVLLTSNPLMEKDLQKKLRYITDNQVRREKTLEWNQKHFLVSRIFDNDYNLRFTKGTRSYADVRTVSAQKRASLHNAMSSRNGSAREDPSHSKSRSTGLGIFMPPLPPSQRFIEKQKIPKNSINVFGSFQPTQKPNSQQSDTNNDFRKDTKARPVTEHSSQRFPSIHRATSMQAGLEMQYSMDSAIDDTQDKNGKVNFKPEVTQSAHFRPIKTAPQLEKSISLPDFKLYEPILEVDSESDDNEQKTQSSRKLSKKPSLEVLCEEELVTKLTRSLPISLMIKANQNINKEVQKRKNVMIAHCKKARDVKTLDDPRWQKLETALLEGTSVRNQGLSRSRVSRVSIFDL